MMRKTLTYSGFIVASLLVFAVFVTATTYIQLGIAVLLYPLLAVFAFKILPRKSWKSPIITIGVPMPSRKVESNEPMQETTSGQEENVSVKDIDKRAFLKLIGGAGLSFFLFSLLNRRVEPLLFGGAPSPETISLKDRSGSRVDPAQRQPTDGYRISEIDDNIITYYGFTNNTGAWFIMQEDTDKGSFRYAKGDFNFNNGWSNREKLQYSYYNDTFNS